MIAVGMERQAVRRRSRSRSRERKSKPTGTESRGPEASPTEPARAANHNMEETPKLSDVEKRVNPGYDPDWQLWRNNTNYQEDEAVSFI